MISNDKFDQELLGKIKDEKIIFKSKRYFFLRNYMIWLAGFLALMIGGLAISVMMYLMSHNDWSIYSQISQGLLEFLFLTLPYFWIFFLTFFIFIVYYNIKHTKKGYSYSLSVIMIVSIAGSVVLGGLFFKIGLGHLIDNVLGDQVPLYTTIFNRQIDFWSHPEDGRLVGFVLSKIDDSEFVILDISQKEWRIQYTPLLASSQIEEKSNILESDVFKIEIGMPIRIFGKKISEDIFGAKKIMQMVPGKKFFMRQKQNHSLKLQQIKNNQELQKIFDEFSESLEKYPE